MFWKRKVCNDSCTYYRAIKDITDKEKSFMLGAKYWDKVDITGGFYEWNSGVLIDCECMDYYVKYTIDIWEWKIITSEKDNIKLLTK